MMVRMKAQLFLEELLYLAAALLVCLFALSVWWAVSSMQANQLSAMGNAIAHLAASINSSMAACGISG
jgi:uncharacterized membrane protein affecting hemolysin expression